MRVRGGGGKRQDADTRSKFLNDTVRNGAFSRHRPVPARAQSEWQWGPAGLRIRRSHPIWARAHARTCDVGLGDHDVLGQGNLLWRHRHAQVAARQHHAVGAIDDVVHVLRSTAYHTTKYPGTWWWSGRPWQLWVELRIPPFVSSTTYLPRLCAGHPPECMCAQAATF